MAKEGTTRFYSDIQESDVARKLGGIKSSNSGAGKFNKSDVKVELASLLIECKTVITEKDSVSIKKEWLKKNKEEAFSQRLTNHCIAFNFGPYQNNYYIIDEKLMRFLVDKLTEENK